MPTLYDASDIAANSSPTGTDRLLTQKSPGTSASDNTYITLTQIASFAASGDTTAFLRDGSRTATGNWNLNSNKITNLASPTAAGDAANKSYVDSVAAALTPFDPVRVATTAAGTLASDFENGDSVDGVTLATNDLILIKDQASGTENGIYTVQASGAPVRVTGMATSDSAAGAYTFVLEGTTNINKGFICSNASGSDVVDTDALVFVQFNGTEGASANAQYVLMAADTSAPNARTLTAASGSSLTLTDGGAGGNATLNVDYEGLTAGSTFDQTNDLMMFWDDSANAFRSLTLDSVMPPFSDANALVKDNSDGTKLIRFEASAITTGTTRVITMPDADVNLGDIGSGGASVLNDLTDVTAPSPSSNQYLRWNGSAWVPTSIDTGHIASGQLTHERGGLEFDASLVTTGDIIAGTGAGTMGLVSSAGHSDGEVLTLQADGTADWEALPGSGDVTAAAVMTDNAVVRGDGGSKGVQDSGVLIDDTDNITGVASITVNNTGLHILDTNASHDLIIAPGSDLTADRTLTLTTGDADRSVTLSGNLTVESASLVNQDLTSDATPTFAGANLSTGTATLGTVAGAIDAGGATSLEIPNGTAPTVNADGEIALDTSVADWSHGIPLIYGGEELGIVAMPIAQFTSPTDGYVIAYNATNDELELVAQSGGGSGFVIDEVCPPATSAAAITMVAGGSTPAENIPSYAFDADTDEYLDYLCHCEGYGGGGLTLTLRWTSASGTSGNVRWGAAIRYMADDTDAFSTSHSYDFNEITAAAPSAAGEFLYDDITFTDGADMDSLPDGASFIVRVYRNADDGTNDTMTGDAYLFGIALTET